jgi:hypothetical protein
VLLNVLTAYWMSNFAVPIIRVGAELQFVNYFVILGAARSVIHVRLWYSLHIHRVSKRLFPRLLFCHRHFDTTRQLLLSCRIPNICVEIRVVSLYIKIRHVQVGLRVSAIPVRLQDYEYPIQPVRLLQDYFSRF